MNIYSMKVNHLTNPLGFRLPRTVFSWKVKDAKGKRQVAARIRVAADENMNELLFDSGFDEHPDSLGYPVELALKPYTRYYWTVTVRTDYIAEDTDGRLKGEGKADHEEATGEVQWFETAKLQEPWSGRWITCNSKNARHPVFEKDIHPAKPVKQARLYICGLGLYEAYFNGKKIGDEYLTPYSNDYDEWLQYQTFDVTEQCSCEGHLAVLLGNGWYKGRFGFDKKAENGIYGDEWKLIAELRLSYEDGTVEIIGTDESWQVLRSRIFFSNLYDGEQRDDTLPDLETEPAKPSEAPKGVLTERMSLPVKVQEIFEPAELIHTPAGELVLDMGQEFTGIFSLRVKAPAGTKIHIQTGEILQKGNFFNANLRSAKSEYIYISDGTEKVIEPHFTFYGYRYVKIEGIPDLKKEDFRGLALYSSIDFTGKMTTGNALVNRLIENVRWGQKSNFLDVPTDCPQRDERMGWTGDAQVFSATAMYLSDSYAFYAKYLYDMAREQSAHEGRVPKVVPSCGVDGTSSVWGDAACIIPWNLYLFYGDKSILEDQFESMKSWVDYIIRIDGDNHGWRDEFHYGDWLALDNPDPRKEENRGGTDVEFIADLYYAVSAGIAAKAAGVLGYSEEAKKYQSVSDEQFDTVKKEYYSVTGRCCVKTQTALILTLKYHLSENIELTRSQLSSLFRNSKGKLKTGFVGTPLLNNVLSENGFDDIAYGLLLNEEYPGWLYEVKLGATTIWERWDSILADGTISGISMNSMNHYAYGSVLEWMFRYVAGINTEDTAPGFSQVNFTPRPNPQLKRAEASYDSASGLYRISWEMKDDSHVKMSVTVPFNCSAILHLPDAEPETFEDQEKNPAFADLRDGSCHLGPGTYSIEYEIMQC